MKIVSWQEFISKDFYIEKLSAATIGTFDGMHKGHIYLLKELFDPGIDERVVFTFSQNPARYFRKPDYPGDIYTLEQKLEALKLTGITTVVLIDFSADFSKLTGKYFISCIFDHLNLSKIVIGADFKCGKDNDTTALNFGENIPKKSVLFKIVPRHSFYNFQVSSTLIRQFIKSGEIDQALKLLEYGYAVDLRELEIFTSQNCFYLNKDQILQVLPDSGQYKLNITENNITSQKEVIIDDKIFKWIN